MGRKHMSDAHWKRLREKAIHMAKLGLPRKYIAKELKTSRTNVQNWLDEEGFIPTAQGSASSKSAMWAEMPPHQFRTVVHAKAAKAARAQLKALGAV